MKSEMKKLERQLDDAERRAEIENVGGHNRRSTEEWNAMVQKLREEKETQEQQYEVEFREFEQMANQKVVQLEEYYVQQLGMKENQVQGLIHQMQQQAQQMNNNNTGNALSTQAAMSSTEKQQM